ncbi:MAG: BamA/TamA family outer membrane protein [Bacteroidota bacterium]
MSTPDSPPIWRLLLSIILLTSCSSLVQAQLVIRDVTFGGLKRTQPFTLHRLLDQQPGDTLQIQRVENDLRALSNRNGIISATYLIDTLPDGVRINYVLQEGVSRYPVALLGGLRDNFWWELGYQDDNWQGRGNTFTALARQIDGRLGGRLNFRQDYWRRHQWGFGFQLERYASQEPLYFGSQQVDYLYDNHNAGANWRYHFDPETDLELGFTYFVEDYEKVDLEQVPGPTQRTERKQLARIAYQRRRLLYDLLQPSGNDLRLSGEFVFQRNTTPFYLFRAVFRRYRPVGKKGLLATRVNLGYAANNDTPFAPFVVDSRVNIRGSGNRVDRGTAMVILNVEYRHLIWQNPWIAVQGVVFSDVGSWRNPGGQISDVIRGENVKYFSGLGLRLISDKARQAVLRIDYGYGLQPLGRRGIVMGLGQYF